MVGMVLIDLQKAFDCVDHGLLLKKLGLMGVGNLDWFRSYLSDRRQCVVVNGAQSDFGGVTCGVPQGSIGGPLLWLCFTCDQPDVVHNHDIDGQDLYRGCQKQQQGTEDQGEHGSKHGGEHGGEACGELVGYVDDGAYSLGHTDPRALSGALTDKYRLLEGWMNNNKLVINPDKTHMMVLGSKEKATSQNDGRGAHHPSNRD